MNILFADNDPDFLNTRAAYLKPTDYAVLKASTPAEAEDLLRNAGIDLAILDVRLLDDDDDRDTSGLALAENPEFRHIPKIVLTGYASVESAQRVLVPGPNGIAPAINYILKEKGPDALLQAVQQAIETYAHKPMVELRQPIPSSDLVKACLQGNCIAFIGAGLSKPAGCPTWQEMVADLLRWAVLEGVVSDRLGQSYNDALRSGEVFIAAEGLIHTIYEKDADKLRLVTYLAEIFQNPTAKPTETHALLAKIPFVGVLTTNVDSLMERTFVGAKVYTPSDTEELTASLAQRRAFILKLSGDLSKPETVQITPTQHNDLVSGNQAYAQFIQKLFLARTILFLGASLDGIAANLEALQCRNSPRQHYALVSVSDAEWQAKAELLQKRYNVQVLPYRTSRTHAEVLTFVQALLAKVTQKSDTRSISGRVEPPRLKRVRLANIGPFEELDLELDPHWNALLGDNGVGKSSILRAIALALCGKDAEPYADRLIKCGQPSGRITLDLTDGSRNTTDLYRTTAGPNIKVLSQRELVGAEQWLAIGFPPLRQVDWTLLNGPQMRQTTPYTSPGDLLPLVKGAIDPRMDDFKQNIINLDYRVSKERDGRSRKLLKELFDLIGCAAVGMTLRLGSINPQTWEITVVTDDGEVPVESVSQGTQSLMGWLAMLLQRLYEVYGEARSPRKKPALVLVDEVDAHMHPAWQQSIVRSLSEFFPKVQFIATTHSPLVVTELGSNQVYVLRRDVEMNRILAYRSDEDFTGFRADQVLTSSLFGLRRSRGSAAATGLSRYSELLGKKRTPDEEHELIELQARVQAWMTAQDSPLARRVEEAIRAAMAQAELPDEITLEIRRQLAELTGSGEPQI